MSFLGQTVRYIAKREAYRGYRKGLKTGLFNGFFSIIGFFGILLILVMLCCNTVGWFIIFLISLIITLTKLYKNIKYVHKKSIPVFGQVQRQVRDRRYKFGYKYESSLGITGERTIPENEILAFKSKHRKERIILILMATTFFIGAFACYYLPYHKFYF